MEVIRESNALRRRLDEVRVRGKRVGFVPTMGFLHEGHASLLSRAREGSDVVVMSIFVNPLQFGPGEDLETYPRDLERDLVIARREGADLVFTPSAERMYPAGPPSVTVDPGPVGEVLEGATRPGHFRGVLTVVAKLFGIVGRCGAYFGEKDAQQLFLIRQMVRDLDLPVDVEACPTIREPDGLALSSRNAYLSSEERAAATCLYRALSRAVDLVGSRTLDAAVVGRGMREVVDEEPLAKLDYATVVSEKTFEELTTVPRGSRAVIAAWVGQTRLIDNMPLP